MDSIKVTNVGKLSAANMRQGSLRRLCSRPVCLDAEGGRARSRGRAVGWRCQVSLQHASAWSLLHCRNPVQSGRAIGTGAGRLIASTELLIMGLSIIPCCSRCGKEVADGDWSQSRDCFCSTTISTSRELLAPTGLEHSPVRCNSTCGQSQ